MHRTRTTDKVDTEIPSPVAGKLLEIKVAEDETVEVGAELAVIGSGDAAPAAESAPAQEAPAEPEAKPEPEAEPEPEAKAEPEPEAKPEAKPAEPEAKPAAEPAAEAAAAPAAPAAESAPASSDSGSYVTPLVRKLATQHGVDLGTLTGSGVGGRIRKQDVIDAAAKAKGSP